MIGHAENQVSGILCGEVCFDNLALLGLGDAVGCDEPEASRLPRPRQ